MSFDTPYVRGADKMAAMLRGIRERTQFVLNGEKQNVLLELMLKANQERFLKQISPTGILWPARAPPQKGRKPDPRTAGKQILERTGAMRDSIKILQGLSAGALGVSTGVGGRIGIDREIVRDYARFHQMGIGVKQRRFLGVAASDLTMIAAAIKLHVLTKGGLK
jgi:hypothetical protein